MKEKAKKVEAEKIVREALQKLKELGVSVIAVGKNDPDGHGQCVRITDPDANFSYVHNARL